MPTVPEYYDSYSNEVIYLNGGGLNCFFLYKRAALDCDVSYQYHEEIIEGPVRRVAWDEDVWRQEALKREGYEVGFLGPGYERCYVHYKSFSNNVDIDARNVALFRRLSILGKMGVLGRGQRVAKLPYDLLFRSARRDIYHVD